MINKLEEDSDDEFPEFFWSDWNVFSSCDDIKSEISDTEVKNRSKTKISKFVL